MTEHDVENLIAGTYRRIGEVRTALYWNLAAILLVAAILIYQTFVFLPAPAPPLTRPTATVPRR